MEFSINFLHLVNLSHITSNLYRYTRTNTQFINVSLHCMIQYFFGVVNEEIENYFGHSSTNCMVIGSEIDNFYLTPNF